MGNGKVEKIKIMNDATNQESLLEIAAVFPFIGLDPTNIAIEASSPLKKDDKGFIIVDHNMQTNIPGIYAIGDIIQKKYRQIATAINDGTIAALNSIEYLKKNI